MNIKTLVTVAAAAVFGIATFSAMAKATTMQIRGVITNNDGSKTLLFKTTNINPKALVGHQFSDIRTGKVYKIKSVEPCHSNRHTFMKLKAPGEGSETVKVVFGGHHKCVNLLPTNSNPPS